MTPFYGHQWKHCRKHRIKYVFHCLRCFDPSWQTPIPLRVQVGKE
jgi:hypothetical protein